MDAIRDFFSGIIGTIISFTIGTLVEPLLKALFSEATLGVIGTVMEYIVKFLILINCGILIIASYFVTVIVLAAVNEIVVNTMNYVAKLNLLNIDIFNDIYKKILIIAFAVFILIVAFQSLKTMFGNVMGFETEEAYMLFLKSILYGVLLLNAKEICLYINQNIFQNIMAYLLNGSASLEKISAKLISDSRTDTSILTQKISGLFTSFFDPNASSLSILLYLVEAFILIIVAVKMLMLCFRFIERNLIFTLLVIMSPLAFAVGVSKSTKPYFQGWVKVFVGNYMIQIFQYVALVLLLTLLSLDDTVLATNMGIASGDYVSIFRLFMLVSAANLVGKAEEIIREVGMSYGAAGTMPGPVAFAAEKMQSMTSLNYGMQSITSMFGGGGGAGGAGGAVSSMMGPKK